MTRCGAIDFEVNGVEWSEQDPEPMYSTKFGSDRLCESIAKLKYLTRCGATEFEVDGFESLVLVPEST